MSKLDRSRSFERAEEFDAVPVAHRRDGWTAPRQRLFIETLAETGCVSEAAAAVGITPRSAYRLRGRADAAAFARAWDRALELATARLTSLAFERVIHGMSETVWKNGECVSERRRPSEKLHIYLLTHLDSVRFGQLAKLAFTPGWTVHDPKQIAAKILPGLLGGLKDVPPALCPAEPLSPSDYAGEDAEDAPPA